METSVDRMFRQLILECTFDTSKNIYEICLLKQKAEFKRFFDIGFMKGIDCCTNIRFINDDFNKEEAFEYFYNEYLKK
jgi:hypothetical protein